MATVNRYTRLTPSEYNPLSLEEMMVVPLAKQKQQEDLLNNKDAVEAELNNLKRLQQDDPFVAEQTKKYKEQLDALAKSVSDEGINRDTARNFRQLYSNYKFDISESGDLGRAQKNYLLAKEREKELRANLAKTPHSQEKINEIIQKGYSNFKGTIGEDGERNEFGYFDAPGYYSPEDEAMQLFNAASSQGFSIGGSGSDIEFVTDPVTGAVMAQVNNYSVLDEEKNNAQNIADAYNSLMTSYSFGDRKAFADLYGYDQKKLTDLFTNLGGVYKSKITKELRDNKSSLQNISSPNKTSKVTQAPSGDIWENIQVGARRGADGGDPLGNRLTSDNSLTFRNSMVGFRNGEISDYRVGTPEESKIKANNVSGGKTSIDGKVLEEIFLDPNFIQNPTVGDVKNGARGAGIFSNGNNLVVHESINHNALIIEGTYNGEKYNLITKDKNIINAFNKYGTTIQGKREYADKLDERRKLAHDLRLAEPFLSSMSDEQILKAYEDTIASRSDYFQAGYKPKNVQNSYYSQSEDLFGKGANLGTIATRKVRVFDEDGSILFPDMKNASAKDIISNAIMGKDWDELKDIKDREEVIRQLNNSTDYGLQVGDHEFVNPMRRSITTKDGKEIFFMIENNNELSGKNNEFQGIDDSSEVQRYLLEGKPFVNKGEQTLQKNDGTSIAVNQWFVQVPKQEADGTLSIIPLVIYGKGEYNSLSEILKDLDPVTLKAKKGVPLSVETQNDVDARVKTVLNRYYDKVANAKTSNADAEKRINP